MKKTPLKTIVKLSRKKSGTVKVSESAIKLFDQANKRIQRLEKENTKRDSESQLKLEDVRSFRNSARAITRGKSKVGTLSKAKTMSVEQYNAQVRLARKVVNDKTLTVKGAIKEEQDRRDTWVNNLAEKYPELEKEDLDEIYNEIVAYNQEHYEDSPVQWLYQAWKESEHSERDRGLMQLLNVGKAHGMSVKESMKWLGENVQNQTWSSLSKKYLSQW